MNRDAEEGTKGELSQDISSNLYDTSTHYSTVERPSNSIRRSHSLDPLPLVKSSALSKARFFLCDGIHSSSRMRLLVFVKIVLKCIDTDDPSVRFEAKHIVMECTKKNREGNPEFIPLSAAIEKRLRLAVGEVHWRRAENLMQHFLITHRPTFERKALKIDYVH
jgi:hypothetical protein